MTETYVAPFRALLIEAGFTNDGGHLLVMEMTLFVTLLCACIILGHLFEENRWINESITALVLGCSTGLIVLISSGGTSSRILEFNEELFFIYLLPPIIFNAGFQVKKKQFFRNFEAIILYGVIGVFISFSIISAGCRFLFPKLAVGNFELKDYLALGAIFSATDSVCTLQVLSQDETPLLYSLVFGEGVVNDATSVVLYRAIQKFDFAEMSAGTAMHIFSDFLYLFFTSTALGFAAGLLSAYIVKTLYFGRNATNREIATMILMAYLSYMIAELFYLSGILAVFFCGIVMSHYTWHNVTEESRVTTRHAFATLSFIAETFIFLYVGMDTLDIQKWKSADGSSAFALSGALLLLVLVGRAAFVFPLSAICNLTRPTNNMTISFRHQIIIWWSGLIRGAVSIALAFNQFAESGATKSSEHATIVSSTIMVVLFTTMVFGVMTKPLIKCIIPQQLNYPSDISEPPTPKVIDIDGTLRLPLLSNEAQDNVAPGTIKKNPSALSLLMHAQRTSIHKLWRNFDNSFMRPVFGGRGFVPALPPTTENQEDRPQAVKSTIS